MISEDDYKLMKDLVERYENNKFEVKNNKPYIIPTKDIENFESLTGIVWPFKE